MSLDKDPDATLGSLIEKYIGPVEEHLLQHEDIEKTSRTRGLANWYRLNYCIANEVERSQLSILLSEQQKESYCLLHEWWTAAYSDESTSLAHSLELIDDCQSLESSDDLPGQWSLLLGHLQLKRWPPGNIEVDESLQRQISPYDAVLQRLYNTEFESSTFYSTMSEGSLRTVDSHRRDASMKAWSQKTSWRCFEFLRGYDSDHDTTLLEDIATRKPQDMMLARSVLERQETMAPPIRACAWLTVG